jgi:hypothetical protein
MKKLNVYLLSQTVNNNYDTYDSAVVIAENEEEAVNLGPDKYVEDGNRWCTWAHHRSDVKVELIGTALPGAEKRKVLASFNAG